jgi:hypothetical protein
MVRDGEERAEEKSKEKYSEFTSQQQHKSRVIN